MLAAASKAICVNEPLAPYIPFRASVFFLDGESDLPTHSLAQQYYDEVCLHSL